MTLRRASRRLSLYYDTCLAPTGLRATQFSILATIHANPALTVQGLAETLDLDRSTAGQNLQPLIRDGLVEAAPSQQDRRARTLSLTMAGAQALAVAQPLWREAQAAFETVNGPKVTPFRQALADLSVPDGHWPHRRMPNRSSLACET
jgi:DNA-binding MarR family transcriptional regulator